MANFIRICRFGSVVQCLPSTKNWMFNRQVWTRLNISQLTEFSIVQSLPVDSCLMLCDIRSLSDDEGSAELVGPRQVGRRKRKAELSAIAESEIRKSLRHLVAAHASAIVNAVPRSPSGTATRLFGNLMRSRQCLIFGRSCIACTRLTLISSQHVQH